MRVPSQHLGAEKPLKPGSGPTLATCLPQGTQQSLVLILDLQVVADWRTSSTTHQSRVGNTSPPIHQDNWSGCLRQQTDEESPISVCRITHIALPCLSVAWIGRGRSGRGRGGEESNYDNTTGGRSRIRHRTNNHHHHPPTHPSNQSTNQPQPPNQATPNNHQPPPPLMYLLVTIQ